MTEEEGIRAHELKEKLYTKLQDLVYETLKDETPEVELLIRTQLTEQVRFWE